MTPRDLLTTVAVSGMVALLVQWLLDQFGRPWSVPQKEEFTQLREHSSAAGAGTRVLTAGNNAVETQPIESLVRAVLQGASGDGWLRTVVAEHMRGTIDPMNVRIQNNRNQLNNNVVRYDDPVAIFSGRNRYLRHYPNGNADFHATGVGAWETMRIRRQ